jgi:hypothetical protein
MGASPDTGVSLIWIAVCFLSILVHELEHGLGRNGHPIAIPVASDVARGGGMSRGAM